MRSIEDSTKSGSEEPSELIPGVPRVGLPIVVASNITVFLP